jgi:hypothetical protein
MEKKDSNILGVIGLVLIVVLLAYTMIDENPPEEYLRALLEVMKDSIGVVLK